MTGRGNHLRFSSNSGRYCISDDGPDITSGMRCEIRLGGRYVRGTIEHSAHRYTIEGQRGAAGYIFFSDEGEVCGLAYGMLIRMP